MKLDRWSRLALFPRLAMVVALGFFLSFTVLAFLGLRAVNWSSSRILEERLVLTEMAASQIEALFEQAYNELLKATTFADFDPADRDMVEEYHLLAHTYGRIGAMTLGVYFLDSRGGVVLAQPPEAVSAQGALLPILRSLPQPGARKLSEPFVEPRTGHPAVAVTLAVRGRDGDVVSYLSGLIDLSSPAVAAPLQQALRLGATGHAELVTAEGVVIASTDTNTFLHPGEHQGFYRAILQGRQGKTVQTVAYESAGVATPEKHIMALVPLSVGGWGLALGGDVGETLAPVASLRRNLLLSGLAMLAASLGVTLWGARRLVRPVLALAHHARAMAEGELATPIRINEGGEIGLLGKSLEEMRQRLLEARQRLIQWNQELEEKVRQRSQELAELQARVELERLKAEFIGQVSHELRTPLGFIKGYASTLLRPDVSPSEDTRQEFLTIIYEESEKLEGLVEELLDASRFRSGTFRLQKGEVRLEELVPKVVERAQTKTEAHSIAFQAGTPLPPLHADAHRLEQVFTNLLDNAIKYSTGGTVTVSARVEDGVVHCAVSDQGEGIPPQELEAVFEPFYRAQTLASWKAGGTGLGLTICKGIVEAHGGRIWAESLPGQGSRFHFTLPLSGAEDEGQPNPHR